MCYNVSGDDMKKFYFITDTQKLLDLNDIGFYYGENSNITDINRLTRKYYENDIKTIIKHPRKENLIKNSIRILELEIEDTKAKSNIYECHTKELDDTMQAMRQMIFDEELSSTILQNYKEDLCNQFNGTIMDDNFINQQIEEMEDLLKNTPENNMKILTKLIMLEDSGLRIINIIRKNYQNHKKLTLKRA